MNWLSRKVDALIEERLEQRKALLVHHERHYEALFERAQAEADRNKAWLFEAWRALRGQSKGLQRQRRLIKRLQAENGKLRQQLSVSSEQEKQP